MADSSDPFEILKQQEAGVPGSPLPAAEVRARGDRMRRRRTAFRALAAAAAVAVVTTGGVALGGGLTTTAPAPPPASQGPQPSPPSPTSTPSTSPAEDPRPVRWQMSIPAAFPLAAGWPDPSESQGGNALTGPGRGLETLDLGACGRTAADPGSTDRVNAVWANVTDYRARELRTFPTDQEAVTYLAHLRNLWQECDPGEGGDDLLRQVRPTAPGDESLALVTGTQVDETTAVTLGVVQVIRVGNAVLADQISTEGGLADMEGDVTAFLADMAGDSQAVVGAMCVFAAEPCQSVPPSVEVVNRIPAGFPLDLAYPEDRFEETELVGPAPDVEVFDRLEACSRAVSPRQTGVDRLGVSFTQPEDTRLRLLTTFDSVEAAEGALAEYVQIYQDCPRQEHEFGGATLTQLRKIEPGDQGYVAIRTFQQQGLPTLGLELLYLVRVGNAVLLQTTSNEGGGNEKQILGAVRQQTRLVADLAQEMCVFSDGGCSE